MWTVYCGCQVSMAGIDPVYGRVTPLHVKEPASLFENSRERSQ